MCPEECGCDYEEYQVDCSDSSLENIPSTFPANVRVLILDSNNITSLEENSFISRGLTELETLTADSCQIRKIELGAFNGLTKLKYLSMLTNELNEITPGTFEKMISLEYLNLSHNSIEHLEDGAFSGLINLKRIELYENELEYIHPNVFAGLSNLKYLDLSYNTGLNISTECHFINSQSLTHLDISGCSVSSVSVETFAELTALERLDLGANYIRSVDINILKALPKLSALYLRGNPLQCDCQLQEVWRWCQDHNIQTSQETEPEYDTSSQGDTDPECDKSSEGDTEPECDTSSQGDTEPECDTSSEGDTTPKCDTPSEVYGIWWGVLEKGQCLEGNISYLGDYKNTSYSPMPVEDKDNENENHYNILSEVQVPVYTALFIFGTTGNVIIIIIIICNKDMRTIPNMYILNLAISDIIYLMAHFSEAYASRISDTWLEGDFMCKFLPFCRRLSVGLSAYSVAVLSIKRYNVIVNPFQIRFFSQPAWRVTVATICGVWIVAALFAIPTVLSGYFCLEFMLPLYISYYRHVVIFELFASCIIPVLLIAFSYFMTAWYLLKRDRRISDKTQNPQVNTSKNTARIVLGITVVFLISYVPYHVFWTYIIYSEDQIPDVGEIISNKDYKLQYTYLISTCLLLINSCLNPVALFCTSVVFRRQFKRYLTCSYQVKSPLNSFEITTKM
jgi:hypothetical protein